MFVKSNDFPITKLLEDNWEVIKRGARGDAEVPQSTSAQPPRFSASSAFQNEHAGSSDRIDMMNRISGSW